MKTLRVMPGSVSQSKFVLHRHRRLTGIIEVVHVNVANPLDWRKLPVLTAPTPKRGGAVCSGAVHLPYM